MWLGKKPFRQTLFLGLGALIGVMVIMALRAAQVLPVAHDGRKALLAGAFFGAMLTDLILRLVRRFR